ncbi:M23 family metallopeptidase [Streptomyces sp. NPDC018031]|uniref:M23 family metallopeptidase n=1 Tax=Streptomyces sp. NPDC018031 TaxID=3365033 RepID=UPI0037B1D8E8
MASNRSALDEAPYGTPTGPTEGADPGPGPRTAAAQRTDTQTVSSPVAPSSEWEEWNPTADSLAPVRGRHRVAKQRGTMARSGAVLGVGVIAAVGAGGMATAKDRPNPPISMPDVAHIADEIQDSLPDAGELPGIGPLLAGGDSSGGQPAGSPQPFSQAGLTAEDRANGTTDAGEALRARIMQQAEHQQNAADDAAREAAAKAAAEAAAKAAAERKADEEAERKAAEAEAERKAAAEAQRKAEAEAERKAEAARKAEAERRAKLATAYALPLASYTLTSTFGEAGDMWSANHTGQDFAAPTGTPVKAVHGGTITEAGWAGAYGYRIVLTLDDGTEVWYCHLSSMVRTSGSVSAGEVIGRVGATGNVTGPHLHLEVRPGGGSPINPLAWLREHGLNP